jgi:hypothetical protein
MNQRRDEDDFRIGRVSHSEAPTAVDADVEVGQSEAVDKSDAVGSSSHIDEIAHALASGAIDPADARAQLIARAVESQLPGLDPEAIAEIRAEVEALLEADPLLERLLS